MDKLLLSLDLSHRKYTKQYVLSLSIIALIAIGATIISTGSTHSQKSYGQVINISGRQRMLTMQVAYIANQLVYAPIEDHEYLRSELLNTTNLLAKNHTDLINGNSDNNVPLISSEKIRAIYFSAPDELDKKMQVFIQYAETFTALSNEMLNQEDRNLYEINHVSTTTILKLIDKLAGQYQSENAAANSRLELSQLATLFALLFALGSIGFMVFRPMIRSVKKNSIELLDKEQRLQAILDNAVDALISFDANGVILSLNPSAELMFDYRTNEIIGKSVTALMPAPQISRYIKYLKNYRKTGEKSITGNEHELDGKRKDGSTFPAVIVINEVHLPHGETIFFGVMRDITLRRKHEDQLKSTLEELQHTNEELERFTYTVSHDLKSPLVTINGFIGLLEEDIKNNDAEGIDDSLNFIKSATKTMHTLLNDLLELSRVRFKQGERIQISFNDLIPGVLTTLTEQIKNKDAAIDIMADMPVVKIEKIRFDEVFLNLIENALKYMDKQASALIHVGYKDSKDDAGKAEFLFFVKDNGRGIQPEYCHQVFDIFERIAVDVEGTGVGLAIVKRIIETHGGRIWVESEGLGKGATFYFTIPVLDNSSEKVIQSISTAA